MALTSLRALPMSGGHLRQLIDILAPAGAVLQSYVDPSYFASDYLVGGSGAAVNSLGEVVDSWSVLYSQISAQVEPLRGRELLLAKQAQQQNLTDVMFSIRYRPNITALMRVRWRGVLYAITSPPIDVDGAQHTLELMATLGVEGTAHQDAPAPVLTQDYVAPGYMAEDYVA